MTRFIKPSPDSIMLRAYIRDGGIEHIEEAMMLACLVHTGGSRQANMRQVQRMMGDRNLNKGKKK